MTTYSHSKKTEHIHAAIKKQIAIAPYTKVIFLRRQDFDALLATAQIYIRNKKPDCLDYDGGYDIKVMP